MTDEQKHYIYAEDVLRFINKRKQRISVEFENNETSEKKTSDPSELVRISRANQRIFGRLTELGVIAAFLTQETAKEGSVETDGLDGAFSET
jgi:hypothetical protein